MASLELFSDEDIKRLERIKQLLKEIKDLDNNFSLSNIIEVNNNTKLIFNNSYPLMQNSIKKIEKELAHKLECECIILNNNIYLDKAIQKENNKIESETRTFYVDEQVVKEETVYYKYPL